MKKLFFVLSFIVFAISLSSCGSEEVCRPRGGYTQVIDNHDTPVVVASYQLDENK